MCIVGGERIWGCHGKEDCEEDVSSTKERVQYDAELTREMT